MTQLDSMEEASGKSSQEGNPADNKKSSSSSRSSTKIQVGEANSPKSSWSKLIKVYRNGQSREPIQIVSIPEKGRVNWPDVVRILHDAVRVPVQKVFSLTGKRVSSTSELEKLDGVVVCGTEDYKMLPYGQDNSFSSGEPSPAIGYQNKFQTNNFSKTKLRKGGKNERGSLAKSVILEPALMGEANSDNRHGSPLMKTFSEQDVSMMDKSRSPKLRMRQTDSPKPRPVSAYQHGNVMSTSAERRSPIGIGLSRIPKRIISTPSPSYSSPIPINPVCSNLAKPKRVDNTTPSAEKSNRQDTSKKEFVRARLVTVIRHGMRPRKAVRFLLNKKTARSYDQVLNELTESIKPDWGAVRKVYTLNGIAVDCLEDFFGDQDIFLACPNDRVGTNDFDLDSEECKSVQPYVKVSLANRQSKFRGLESSRSPHRRPKSCSNSQQNHLSSSYPSHPKYIPLAHFPSPIVDKYYVGNVIGDGNFAVVRDCTNRQSKQRFALKVIDKSKCKGRDAPPEHEVKILGMVNHPNVIEMYEQYDFSNELYIVLELVEGGDLFDAIAEVTKFSEKDGASMTKDIASALAFLHSHRIIHRDIKPENLLVYTQPDGGRRIKLGDFGLAQIVDGPLYTVCGTPTYVAPEILAETGYGLKVDVWALGVIVYVLLCGYPPFVSPTGEQEDLFDLILAADYDFPTEHWENISGDAKDIITRMIEPDSDMRLSADEVMDHPWLATGSSESQGRRSRYEKDFKYRVFEAMGLTNLPISPSANSTMSTNNIKA